MLQKLSKHTMCLLILIMFAASSCEKASISREYEEIVIESPLILPQSHSMDPHEGLQMPVMKLPTQQQTNDPSVQRMLDASVAKLPLQWKTPKGWEEFQGSSMRLVTFKTNDINSIECTIVVLGGMAGGLQANVIRWMRQIDLTDVSDRDFSEFMGRQEEVISESGISIQLVDLSQLYPFDSDQHPTMIAGIATVEGNRIFIKMTGTFRGVSDNKKKFKSLCRSLRLADE